MASLRTYPVLAALAAGILMAGCSFIGDQAESPSAAKPEKTKALTPREDKCPDPVGYWAFNEGEGTNIVDSSGNGNNGYIVNNMRGIQWAAGRSGRGLAFTSDPSRANTSGCVVVPGMNKYDFTNGITIEAWIMPDKDINLKALYEIVSDTAASNHGPGFRFLIHWQRMAFNSGDRATKKTWGASTDSLKTPIYPGTWQHVAGTYDGSVFKVYIDGEEGGASAADLKMSGGHERISIGSIREGASYGFMGVIDEVKIYDRALSAVQILKHVKFD